ncbi:MAG: SpoIIE family protein phosphatase [Acidobacteria bacterium]|nr:SpoIIE family protein phosphatase [Acidobacteriota bacterium]
MEASTLAVLRDQLVERRHQLQTVTPPPDAAGEVTRLLQEVDAALERMEAGTFGLCEACAEPIETERLLADPLRRFCLDHLRPGERRALEQDLELASRMQRELLPRRDVCVDGWEIAYHYQPAGAVSGDYCDVIPGATGDLYFLIGDVSGKGVAAAMLMAHLSAMLRTLVSVGLPLTQLVERASRVFCESTLPAAYATLVCGRASATGDIELCNAGHPPPLVIRGGAIAALGATGLPIGMFCSERFSSQTERLGPGDAMLLYTDGLTEAQDPAGDEYGIERLAAVASSASRLPPQGLVGSCVRDVGAFRRARALADDLTVMALRRAEARP